jgi:capsular polysaccharide biosynthesis protein
VTLVYWFAVLRRRWPILAVIIILVALASGLVAIRSYRHHHYVASVGFFVTTVSLPTGNPQTSETAANLLGDDLLDIAHSSAVAHDISRYLASHHLASITAGAVQGAIGGSRTHRTVTVTATSGDAHTALAIARGIALALTTWRSRYMGKALAQRSSVTIINQPSVSPASTSRLLLDFAFRAFLGVIVALGVAFAWDFLDDTVHNEDELERWLGAPVLVRIG